ncbi:hypothetical protein FD754_011740, partial [Muntiacus muntjak]
YLWDQAEDRSLGTPLSLEEQILNSTFEACDPQRTGTVAVTHLLAYLEAVTGRGPQDARLQTLACSLDPSGEGPQATVDLDTFLVVMRDWITACQLDGGSELEEEAAFGGALASRQLPSGCSEVEDPANLESFGSEDPRPELPATADLLSSLEDLELSNRRLAGENAKLQRSVETAEERSARLGEEISALRKQLRSTQQALQFARGVDEELEDLKTLAKSLEEQNRSLLAQARYTEKEQQRLVAEMETLQEEYSTIVPWLFHKILSVRAGQLPWCEAWAAGRMPAETRRGGQLTEDLELSCSGLKVQDLESDLSLTLLFTSSTGKITWFLPQMKGLEKCPDWEVTVTRVPSSRMRSSWPTQPQSALGFPSKQEETAVDLSSPLLGGAQLHPSGKHTFLKLLTGRVFTAEPPGKPCKCALELLLRALRRLLEGKTEPGLCTACTGSWGPPGAQDLIERS